MASGVVVADPADDPTTFHQVATHYSIASSNDPLLRLGADVFHLVLEQSPPAELLNLSGVSSTWRDYFATNGSLWIVDLREWQHTVAEIDALARDEPYIPVDVSCYQDALKRRDLSLQSHEYRSAFRRYLQLEHAWEHRLGYESLLPAPAFRLRKVYMDHEEDTLYARTQSEWGSQDYLLVWHKYTGQLLLRVPISRAAEIKVGAGYVAVSDEGGPEADFDVHSSVAGPLGNITVYRTPRAAARVAANASGARKEWKPRSLPLEYYTTNEEMQQCPAMDVGLLDGEGVLVAVNYAHVQETVLVHNLDTGQKLEFSYADSQDRERLFAPNATRRESTLESIKIHEKYIYIVFQGRVLVFDGKGERVLAFPDVASSLGEIAACVYPVGGGYPYNEVPKRRPQRPEGALPGLDVADTLAWPLRGLRAYDDGQPSEVYRDAASAVLNNPHPDAVAEGNMDPKFRDVHFTHNHLILRGNRGAVLVVANYRDVLREALKLSEQEQAGYIGRHSALLSLVLRAEVVATEPHSDRLALHCCSTCVFVVDLTMLPEFPLEEETQNSRRTRDLPPKSYQDPIPMDEIELEAVAEDLLIHLPDARSSSEAEDEEEEPVGRSPGEEAELSHPVAEPSTTDNNPPTDADESALETHAESEGFVMSRSLSSDHAAHCTPCRAEPLDLPSLPAYYFEISCLEHMAEISSIVMDSRAVYMCDWDKGWPDIHVYYEDLHDWELTFDTEWEVGVRPNFGHVKIWTFRPNAALLRRPGVAEWQQAMSEHYGAMGIRHEHSIEEDWEERHREGPDWADLLEGFAWLGFREPSDDDERSHDGDWANLLDGVGWWDPDGGNEDGRSEGGHEVGSGDGASDAGDDSEEEVEQTVPNME